MLQSLKNTYHFFQALLANLMYGFPASSMKVICVTGTDGKTTTSGLLYHILRSAGKKTALLTTVSAVIDGKAYETGAHVTTPSPFALQKYVKKAKQAKAEYFILEATSHGIDQNRIWGVPIMVGVLTNISREHLDYHKTYERYVKAKCKMLRKAKNIVINKDDASYEFVMDNLKKYKGRIMTYGMTKTARINMKNFSFSSRLLGTFNDYNCLAAAGALTLFGIDEKVIKKGIASFKPPIGRQQVVYNHSYRVMVDFAHTPNSFLQVLPAIKRITNNRLIHIFGSAGLRDVTKRPEMGKAASTYDDIIVLTAEDPRGEPVEKIAEDIKKGIYGFTYLKTNELEQVKKGGKYCFIIPDRKEAITFGVALAHAGDTVVMTGKSHEKSMNYDGKLEETWDEFGVAKEAIEKKLHAKK